MRAVDLARGSNTFRVKMPFHPKGGTDRAPWGGADVLRLFPSIDELDMEMWARSGGGVPDFTEAELPYITLRYLIELRRDDRLLRGTPNDADDLTQSTWSTAYLHCMASESHLRGLLRRRQARADRLGRSTL